MVGMEGKNKIFFYGFLISIAIIWVIILTLDGSRLFFYSTTLNAMESQLSKVLKLLLSFLVALFVWIRKSNSWIKKKDRIYLCVTFMFFFAAEIFFYIKNYYAGIGIFSFAQLTLTIRNSSGILGFLKSNNFHREIPRIVLIILGVIIVTTFILWKLLLPNSTNPLFILTIGYGLLLTLSTIISLLTPIIGYFPSVSSNLIATGSILFYIGDITVGLNLFLPPGIPYIISSSLTWLFYLPAIVLFALSGVKFQDTTKV